MPYTRGHLNSRVFALSLILCSSVTLGLYKRTDTDYYKSYRLAGYSIHTLADSEIGCAVKCLAEICAAFQWDTETGACYLQDRLNVTESNGHLFGAMLYDCAGILEMDPTSQSGVYFIPVGKQQIRQVWCDMDTDGGGWAVFLRRLDGSVDFYREFAAYKEGFGDANGEYWLGLETLHALTARMTYQLRVDVSDWEGASVYSLYSSVVVADEAHNYTLQLGSFVGGEGGDGLSGNNGMQFTTKDADRDFAINRNCAVEHKGAFWYHRCSRVHPTAKYYEGGTYTSAVYDGMQWRSWSLHNDFFYSMKIIEMKIKSV